MSTADVIAIIVVTILNIILGMLWYSPKFLGTIWAKAHNFDLSKLHAGPMHYVGAILVSLLTACVFFALIYWFDVTTIQEGVGLAFFIWLGFIVTTHFSGVLWAQKPLTAYFIDTGFQLISMLMMGAILSVW